MLQNRKITISVGRVSVCLALVLLALSAATAHPEVETQIADVTASIESDPGNPRLYIRRGELHRIHRDWAAAERDFLMAGKLEPKLAEVDFHRGRLSLDAGRASESLKLLNRFLAASPENVEGLVARARARVELGQFRGAAADFTAALGALGENGRPRPTYYLERAKAQASTDRLDAAIRGLDEGLARLGQPVTLQLYAIELELQRERYDDALARLDRIAGGSPRKESWWVRRGEILEEAGRPVDARGAYEDALEAIATLPASRRWNRAVVDLETSAQAALERLTATTTATTKTTTENEAAD